MKINDSINKDLIFSKIQTYLKRSPVIIWGSGATIPVGMPSMQEIKNHLNITEEGNIENILSDIQDNKIKERYEQEIYSYINKKDAWFRANMMEKHADVVKSFRELVNYFYKSHPQKLNIITTNYDCILEYILSYYGFPYSDGFSGREFSTFDTANFKNKNNINLYKVHGSLRWFNKRYCCYNSMMDGIFPTVDKHFRATQDPFRALITKADEAINEASCFLVIGFGFNDEHLTPRLYESIDNKSEIVVVTKKATESLNSRLQSVSKYIIIEEGDSPEKTNFRCQDDNSKITEALDGRYWHIEEFNNILF